MLSNLFTSLHNSTSSLYNYNLMFKHTRAHVCIYIYKLSLILTSLFTNTLIIMFEPDSFAINEHKQVF